MKFMIIAWYMRKWRNLACFESRRDIPQDKPHFLEARFSEILTALNHGNLQPHKGHPQCVEDLVRWEASPPRWVILNTDGASKGNPGPAREGGVIRDHQGHSVCGFIENMGCCTSTKAELKAMLRGLRIAKEKRLTKVLVRIDSQLVVNMLKSNSARNTEHTPIIAYCRYLIKQQDWEVIIGHCYRETNKVADKLTNMVVSCSSSCTIFDTPPREVTPLLFADNVGVSWPRLFKV